MSIRKTMLLAGIVLMGLSAWAQDYPKAEVSADFSFVHFNPSRRFTSAHNIFGGGGSLTYNFSHLVGIKMDLQGYGSQTNAFTVPAGTRIGTVTTLSPVRVNVNGNLFTYLFGPQFKKHSGRFDPYVQALVGGAHSNVYGNLFRTLTLTGIGAAPSNNAFAFTVGGGLDIKLSHAISFRPAEFGYLLTHFSNQLTGNSNTQNNFRYAAGVVFGFGGE
jgi:opacity protein-like surface antigen